MKISSLPPKTPAVDAVDSARDVAGAAPSSASTGVSGTTATAASDPVAQIAADVSAGRIGQKEAVDRILAEVLHSPMVESVPDSVRAGLEDALRSLLSEDPQLHSLVAAIGPDEIK